MVQRANSRAEQTQEAEQAGPIPDPSVALHVNHRKRTIDYVFNGGSKTRL